MSKRRSSFPGRWLTVLVLLAMVLTGISTGANAQGLRDAETPAGGAEPNKIIQPSGAKPGVYYLDYGSYQFNSTDYPVDGTIRFYSWSTLNTGNGAYNWTELDNWIASRKALGLGTGIMITTYDGSTAGDIRSTPNYVIKTTDAVLPATYKDSASSTTEYPHYINYWKRASYNANFDSSPHDASWNLTGNVAVVSNPPADADNVATGWAAALGGGDNNAGTLAHSSERIPAMPASLNGTKTVEVTARIGIATTDFSGNDHLYMELWDTSGNKLGGTQVDINSASHANGTWKDYTFDVSAFGTERYVVVAFRVVTDGANPTTFYVDNVTLNVRHLIPKYWSTAYSNAYKTFISALGARYKSNSDLQFVAMGTGVYGENQPTQSDNFPGSNFDHVVANAGLTSQGWIDYVNSISSAYASAFNLIAGQGPNRHILLQFAPTYKSIDEREKTTDYAAGVSVGLSDNFLSPDWTQAYRSDNDGFYDPIRKYWNQVPIAFEAYSMDLCNPLVTYWAVVGGVEKHADYLRVGTDLFYDFTTKKKTANAEFFDWAGQYLGKTVQNTQRVWTVMREHRNPTLNNCRPGGIYYLKAGAGGTYPQLGNYNFWLYQVDGITGGKTVAETNDKGADSRYARNPDTGEAWTDAGLGNCPTTNGYRADLFGANYPCNSQPYNPDLPAIGGQGLSSYTQFYLPDNWTGEGKEAYIVRRTDQNADAAKNNPYMFFMIDDGYIPGTQQYKATIKVGYFDIGTDKWTLKYHSTSGEKPATISLPVEDKGKTVVTKKGTKLYKEVTFEVTDARFANGLMGGSDFYIDSRSPEGTNDGNEWVHIVEVEKLDSILEPTYTPTVTTTPTQTLTPTATATSTPTTGVVEGRVYNDADKNGKYDAGEGLLQGAVMALKDTTTGTEQYTATSTADGIFRFAAVAPGQYTLTEKAPPPGYQPRPEYTLTFLVQANTTLSYQTLSLLDVWHLSENTPTATATITATPTATATMTVTPTSTPTATEAPPTTEHKIYLPLLLR